MSNVQAMADAEAQRAEAEQPDEDEQEAENGERLAEPDERPEQPEQPDETTPQPSPPATEAEMKKTMDRLEREAVRHAGRIAEIMGDDAQVLEPCPRCWELAPGFVMPGMPISDEQRTLVKLSLGEQVEPELRQALDKTTCDECGGPGKTKTGASESAQYALPCRKCAGQGWIAVLDAPPIQPTGEQNGRLWTAGPAITPAVSIPDQWGRPPSHPDWGKHPASVNV